MTLDEIRDTLAAMDGWKLEEGEHHEWSADDRSITTWPAIWIKGDDWIAPHPHPPTLDGADSAVPEGWTWTRHATTFGKWWAAYPPDWNGESYPTIPDTGNKIADLYTLALACRKAMEEKQ